LNNDIELIKRYVNKTKHKEAINRLKNGEPVQYIIGNVEFCDTLIEVNENVLIPRFETELLVDKTIKLAKKKFNQKINILDLGTGSGCIAISLKKSLNANVIAIDISQKALEVAKKNAILNNVNIMFENWDMNNPYLGKFDLIISNPPYIGKNMFVEEKVLKFEPSQALFAEDEGLYYYKKIINYLPLITSSNFLVAFEIGDNQKEKLDEFLKDYCYKYVFEKDLTNRYRYLFIYNE